MKSHKILFSVVTALLALQMTSQMALAAGESASPAPAAGTSTTSEGSSPMLNLDNYSLVYSTLWHGASFSDFTNGRTVSPLGAQKAGAINSGNAINFDGDLSLMYKVSKTFKAGIYLPFLLAPVNGLGVIRGDFGVKLSQRDIIKVGNFSYSGDLMLQAPTSVASGGKTKEVPYGTDMDLGIKTMHFIKYTVPSSDVVLGAINEVKYYMGVIQDKTFKIVAMPYVRYNFSDMFAAQVNYEMDWRHYVGESGFFNFNTYQTDLQPGIVWNITKKVTLNPYAQIFTTPAPTGYAKERVALGGFFRAEIL